VFIGLYLWDNRVMRNTNPDSEVKVMSLSGFYKVLVLDIDVFESVIVDERHFSTVDEAMVFCYDIMNHTEYTTVTVKM